jgi:hypothetical protein
MTLMRRGTPRAAIQQGNLMPPTLERSSSEVHLAYLLLRENLINRLFQQRSGYWQSGLRGLDTLTDADYGAVFEEVVLPELDRFAPQLLIVSAGFDAHARDPLAQMRVTERGFAAMCTLLAARVPRLVLLLEGGYHLDALCGSVRACVEVLRGGRETFPSGAGSQAVAAIAATRGALGRLQGGVTR